MASLPPQEDQQLERLARLVGVIRHQGITPTLLSVIEGWQGHLRVRVAAPEESPWVGIALARGEQMRDPTTGLPRTLSVLVQGAHGAACVPVEYLEALEVVVWPS